MTCIISNEVARPAGAPADLKNEDFKVCVVTNAKSEKMSASDIDGHGDDDDDDGRDGDQENQSLQRSVCENVLQILDRAPPKPWF